MKKELLESICALYSSRNQENINLADAILDEQDLSKHDVQVLYNTFLKINHCFYRIIAYGALTSRWRLFLLDLIKCNAGTIKKKCNDRRIKRNNANSL